MNALPKLLKLSLLPLLAVSLQAASTYKVQSGDTLSSIARKNGTTPAKLMSDNGLKNANMLLVGQTLKIPSGSSQPTSTPAKRKPATPTSSGRGNYTVKAGETLYSIARTNGLSVSQLTGMNPGLDPSKLSVGQQINLKKTPAQAKKNSTSPPPAKKKAPVIAEKKVKLVNAPSPALVIEAPKPEEKKAVAAEVAPPSTIASVLVEKEISFGALANRHRTSTQQLNALNGWRLKPTTVLAKGSEVYVPGT